MPLASSTDSNHRTEAAEGYSTLTAFMDQASGTKQNHENFYLILWGGLLINPTEQNIEV